MTIRGAFPPAPTAAVAAGPAALAPDLAAAPLILPAPVDELGKPLRTMLGFHLVAAASPARASASCAAQGRHNP